MLLDGVETQRFEYDENGRVTRILRDGLDQRLIWDALDRLVRIEDQNFIEDPVDFDYDGQGRRVSADRGSSGQRYVVGPTGNQSLESPHLVHNGAFLTGELVYNGEHALWRYQGDGTLQTRVYLRDAMGSVIGLMDENGQLIESFDYDAFGNVRRPGGEALPEVSFGGDSRFQGMWKDSGTGLYYVRARYYDARTGRFLSRDPAEGQLETPESFMPYVFANGNPYLYADPTGRAYDLGSLMTGVLIRIQNAGAAIGRATAFRAAIYGSLFNVGLELGQQAIQNGGLCIQMFDGSDLLVAAVAGAAGGTAINGIYRLQTGLWALTASAAVGGDIGFLEYLTQKQINEFQNRAALACVGDDQIDPLGFFGTGLAEIGFEASEPVLKLLAKILRRN